MPICVCRSALWPKRKKTTQQNGLLLPAQTSVVALGYTLSAQPGIEYCLSMSNIAFYQIKCFQFLYIMFDIKKAACSALLCSNYLPLSPHWLLSWSDLQANPAGLLDRDQLLHFGS